MVREIQDSGRKPAHDTTARLVAGWVPCGLAPAEASRLVRQRALDWLGPDGGGAIAPRRPAGGAPGFPPGWVGSLSHTDGAAAVLAVPVPSTPNSRERRTCGVDIEPLAPLPPDVAAFALTDAERAWVAARQDADPAAGRRLFSAKECVHKAVYPVSGIFLEFDEVEIEVGAWADRHWQPRPLSDHACVALADCCWTGGWASAGGFGLAWLLGTGVSGGDMPVSYQGYFPAAG